MKKILNSLLGNNKVIYNENYVDDDGETINVQVRKNGWQINYPEGKVYYKNRKRNANYYLRDVEEFLGERMSQTTSS
jgi:hypothetical protein